MARRQKKVDAEKIPSYSDPTQYGFVLGTELNNWDSKITNEKLRKMYLRTGFCYRILNKLSDDVFDNGFFIDNNDPFAEDVYALNDKISLATKMKQAFKYSKLFGYSFLALGWQDTAERLEDEPRNVQSLDYVVPLSPEQIDEIILDEDEKSERYGEVEYIVLQGSTINDKKKIHWKRFIHLVNDNFNNNPKGVSSILPAYNYLETLENILWSAGQAYYRNAAPFANFNVKNADKTDLEAIDEEMDDINVRTRFLGNDDFQLKFEQTQPNDPTPFVDVMLTAVSSTLAIPKQIVIGTAAGAVTGSETNLKDYYSDISSTQTLVIEPLLRQLYTWCMDYGILPVTDDYDIEWESLFEMDEKDKALTYLAKSQAYKNYAEAGFVPPEEQPPIPEFLTDEMQVKYSEMELQRLDEQKQKQFDDLENRYFELMTAIFHPQQAREIVSVIDRPVTEEKPSLLKSIRKRLSSKSDEPPDDSLSDEEVALLREEIEEKARENERRFIELLPMVVENVLRSEDILKGDPGYQEAYDMIYSNNFNYIKGFNEDLRKDLAGALSVGVQSGWNPDQIRSEFDRILTTMTNSRLKAIVRTETSRAVNSLEFRNARANGMRFKTWVTVGDERVRPMHEAISGETVPIEEPFSIGVLYPPADVNCRCWVVYS
jgi:phage-related protein (TIGR01555 family)